jgi:hypothetical protein
LLDWEVVQEEIDNLANPVFSFNLSRKSFLQDIVEPAVALQNQ